MALLLAARGGFRSPPYRSIGCADPDNLSIDSAQDLSIDRWTHPTRPNRSAVAFCTRPRACGRVPTGGGQRRAANGMAMRRCSLGVVATEEGGEEVVVRGGGAWWWCVVVVRGGGAWWWCV